MYVEGMFCRLPIITYDHGGQTDFLEDGRTGFLVPLNDQDAFRKRLEWLIQNPELRKTMGNYNLALSRRFTVEHCALRYEQLFEEMISGEPSSCSEASASDFQRSKGSNTNLASAIDR